MKNEPSQSSVTPEMVRSVLDQIIDPCSAAAGVPAGLCEMGLVRQLEIEATPNGAVIAVKIAVTEPFCFMALPFSAEVRQRLSEMEGVKQVVVTIDQSMDWSEDDMTPAYRQRLQQQRDQQRQIFRLKALKNKID